MSFFGVEVDPHSKEFKKGWKAHKKGLSLKKMLKKMLKKARAKKKKREAEKPKETFRMGFDIVDP